MSKNPTTVVYMDGYRMRSIVLFLLYYCKSELHMRKREINCISTSLLLHFNLLLLQHQIRTSDTLPNILYIFHHSFEVGCGIVGLGYENVVILSSGGWSVDRSDRNKSEWNDKIIRSIIVGAIRTCRE